MRTASVSKLTIYPSKTSSKLALVLLLESLAFPPFLLTMALLVMLFFMIGVGREEATIIELWPVLALFAVIGAACGAAASILSRPNKANSADTKNGAAD